MADIESGGVYHKTGGASGRFSGAYQFGAAEISETAKHLGETPPTREQFLSDPAMQERYLTQYTLEHHQYLMKHSAKYAAMSPRDKLKILGYAHNQGAGGALTYLNTGRVGHDAFGTAGTAYASKIQKYFDMLDRGEKFGGPSGKPVPPPIAPTTATGQPASVVDTQTGKVISNVGTGKVVGDLHIMEGVDPRLIDIAMSGAKYLPAGYTLHPVSGIEGRRGQSYGFHPRGLASDWQIYDPSGKPIPNRGDDYSGLYTLWARGAYTEAIKKYPGIANQIGWGGAFATVPGGTTPDLMHIDLGGQRGGLRPGNVLNKLGPLSAEEQERALKKSGTQEETPKPAEEPKKEEPAKPKPTIIEHRGKDEVDENAHPVNRVKVDNRSDMDVVKDRQAA
jgi:hypothetical protein